MSVRTDRKPSAILRFCADEDGTTWYWSPWDDDKYKIVGFVEEDGEFLVKIEHEEIEVNYSFLWFGRTETKVKRVHIYGPSRLRYEVLQELVKNLQP
jgi:hypothetical protein